MTLLKPFPSRELRRAATFAAAPLLVSMIVVLAHGVVSAMTLGGSPQLLAVAAGVSGPALVALVWATVSKKGLAPLCASLPATLASMLTLPAFAFVSLVGISISGADYVAARLEEVLAALAFQVLVVGLLEETGWRGYLAHRMLAHARPIDCAIIVAAAWFAWHAPKFAIGGLYVALLGVGCLVNSIVLTWLVRHAGLVACMIFHGAFNLSLAVIDTEQTSMAAQYAGFGATILLSTGLAAVLLVRARAWFFGEAAR
jgi:membrane protease YdiL (CAAX protease family)